MAGTCSVRIPLCVRCSSFNRAVNSAAYLPTQHPVRTPQVMACVLRFYFFFSSIIFFAPLHAQCSALNFISIEEEQEERRGGDVPHTVDPTQS